MHNETLEKLTNAAKNKINMLNNSKLKYLVSSAFAGLYVGLGIILIFTVGGLLSAADSPMTKIMMGLSFAVALCLVVMTGSELFTGNNMVMSAGMLNKGVSGKSVAKVWMYSYIGNLLGSLLVAAFFVGSGLVDKDYRERMYILSIFQLAFSSQDHVNKVFAKIENWNEYKNTLSDDINDLDWRSFQQEYRDYIDLAKLLQLVPGIGAVVGAYVNNKLVDKLGEYAMYAYRMRILSDEVCVTKKTSWFSKMFVK